MIVKNYHVVGSLFFCAKRRIMEKLNSLSELFRPLINEVADLVVRKLQEEKVEVTPRYYTRKEVAEILHVTLPTIHNMVKRGDIMAKKVNGRVLFNAEAIDNAVRDSKVYRDKHSK